MQYKNILATLVLGLSLTTEVSARGRKGGANAQFGGKGGASSVAAGAGGAAAATGAASQSTAAAAAGGAANVLALNPSAVQTGSQNDGLQESGVETGDAPSNTDPANFINFCAGKTLTNGLQVTAGSCNGIVMGDIPAQSQMVSTIITSPTPGQDIPANTDFNLSANIQNIQAGSFTNADSTYYAAPQELNAQGQVIGHTHFTVQDMAGNIAPTTALNAATFAFFKGVDSPADAQGNLAIPVTGGLPAGTYRVCTMSSASNHQPVLMPVAQRGAQDDCTKFTVGGGAASGSAAGGAASASAAGGAASATAAGGASSVASGAATQSSAAAGGAKASSTASGQQTGQGSSNSGSSNSGSNNNGSNKGSNKNQNKGSSKGSNSNEGASQGQSSSGKPPCPNTKKARRSWNA